ncbi:MAG TPA: nucleoside 2-deoxyribosyltransferase [Rhizomicrobium sp.]|jgi:nucleoside 2-deoxyribosyltransferase|nr:nucleoside 2-deoxyribosyltransferase [Rhizomicrobium sp.]
MTIKAYLAGPEVFLPNAAEIGEHKKQICARHGITGLFSLDSGVELAGRTPEQIAHAIFSGNIALMEQADLLIANMTPFRGPSMDAGTAFEVGFCTARNMPVFGYTNVAEKLIARVAGARRNDGVLVDEYRMEIEDFGFHENLMIEVPARESGRQIFAGAVPKEQVFTCLSVFEIAVRHAAESFTRTGAVCLPP